MKFIYHAIKYLYGSIPFEVQSDFDIEESILKLSKIVSSIPYPINELRIRGFVSKNRISFRKTIPFIQNSFKPIFVGKLVKIEDCVVLKGKFSVHWLTRLFYTIVWLFLVTVAFLPIIGYLINKDNNFISVMTMFFVGLCMWVASVGLVVLGRRFSRNDTKYLSDIVKQTLSK